MPTAGTGYLVNQIGTINYIISSQIVSVGEKMTIRQENGKLYKNNELVNTVTPNTFQVKSGYNLYLFAQRPSGSSPKPTAYDNSNLYNVKIWQNGELIRDYIPVLDADSKPCMYDTVSKQTFYNQGTGEFLYAVAK